MESLFITNEKDLAQLLETFPEDDIQEQCSSQVYYRGVEYFENGFVRNAEFNADKTRLSAEVRGSRIYNVEIRLKNRSVHASCTCPQDIFCKHAVAVMLFAAHEHVDSATSSTKSPIDIKKYLDSLSKEELAELVMKHAPEEFFTTISNKHSETSDAVKTFNKAKRSLQDIFSNDELLYDPGTFEESLMKVIKKLSGLERKIPNELSKLILYIIEEVENAMDEGYLYDHYSDYNYEPSEQFYAFMANCITAMDFNKKTEFLGHLDDKINNSSYSTFSGAYEWLDKGFTDDDLPHLRILLIASYEDLSQAVVERYYSRVSAMLTNEEKEKILTVLAKIDCSHAIELAGLLDSMGKRKKSILMLRQLVSGNSGEFVDERLCFLYLDQMNAEKLDLREAAMTSIKQCPKASILQKIVELLTMESASYEPILEKEDPEELLNYLESSGRITDALALVERNKNIWHDRIFTFYKRNKKAFPQKAGKYFSKTIDENLKNTGDYYYHTIADALKHLKQIDKESAHELRLHLQQHYKRRSKLMMIIKNI